MKKIYKSPKIRVLEIEEECIVAASNEPSIEYNDVQMADEDYEVLSNKQRPGIWNDLW